jgi:hypothetical protein
MHFQSTIPYIAWTAPGGDLSLRLSQATWDKETGQDSPDPNGETARIQGLIRADSRDRHVGVQSDDHGWLADKARRPDASETQLADAYEGPRRDRRAGPGKRPATEHNNLRQRLAPFRWYRTHRLTLKPDMNVCGLPRSPNLAAELKGRGMLVAGAIGRRSIRPWTRERSTSAMAWS